MKFSSSLKFNAVSEWWDDYIAYDALKKCIYQLEKRQHHLEHSTHDLEANEHTTLIDGLTDSSTDAVFIPLLDRELRKINIFYDSQEREFLSDVDELEKLVKEQEETGLGGAGLYMDFDEEEEDDDDEEPDHRSPSRSRDGSRRRRRKSVSFSRRAPSGGSDVRMSEPSPSRRRYSMSSSEDNADLEASLGSLHNNQANHSNRSPFSTVRSLASKLPFMPDGHTEFPTTIWTAKTNYAWDTRSYVEINYSGFRKILKKYDKVTGSELQDRYLHEVVEHTRPFTQQAKSDLNSTVDGLVELYAKCVTRGNKSAAKQQLKLRQREHIAWERDTVWRQMIGRERRGESDGTLKVIDTADEDNGAITVPTPVGRLRVTRKKLSIVVALAVFLTLLNMNFMRGAEANRCLAILIFSTIMWATEAIPLFVTSLFVPFLIIVLRVIRSTDGMERLSTPDTAKYVFSSMFSPTIMLLIGGFTIASALRSKPSVVLLTVMGVSCFASMWITNVAAPTLCLTLVRPILRTLPHKASFGPALVLAIALAANIGGQSSPISSPQNLIALQAMDPPLDWSNWFAVAIPVSAISIVLIWLLILASYRPGMSPDGEGEIEIKAIRPAKEPFTLKQYWVSFVCLTTIALWCVEHKIQDAVGDMGVIAILPIFAFFSTGVLKKDDFEQFAWTIVFLAMGGIALGKAVASSGLLQDLDTVIRDIVGGFSLYAVVLALSTVVLIISTFISHTIASVLLVPIAKEVGSNLPGNHSNLLIFITGLVCSAGMGMPVSGFPNQIAATQEDELGLLYLSNVDFLKNGIPASIITTLVVATFGFLLMKVIGL